MRLCFNSLTVLEMSINVNVTGNPVKIHRGKMVTADPDYIAKEFQKRRRMRLEQVSICSQHRTVSYVTFFRYDSNRRT